MTICIGLIPNDKTVMLLQDSEMSFHGIGFTQDIANKIKKIDENSIAGVVGDPRAANEVIFHVKKGSYDSPEALRASLENAYNAVKERRVYNVALRKYGFNSMRDFVQTSKESQIDPNVSNEILRAVNDCNSVMSLSIVLASNMDSPELYHVDFPGVGALENNVKMYVVSGSGTIMAIDKLGEELQKYRWQPELSIDEGIDVLMRAGKASEKHAGVGGPFDITYITKDESGKNKIVKPDQKKINMVMYLFPFRIKDEIMGGCIERMRNPDIKSEELADYIKSNINVGIEFDTYFGGK